MFSAEEFARFLYRPESSDKLATLYFAELVYSFLTAINNILISKSFITIRALVAMSNDILQCPGQPQPETPLLLSLCTQCREIASLILRNLGGMELDDEQNSTSDSQVLTIIETACSGKDMTQWGQNMNDFRKEMNFAVDQAKSQSAVDEQFSVLLSSHAAKLSEAIFNVLTQGHLKPSDLGYKVANDIAVRLHLINTYLDSLPPYWIELGVELLCHSILRDLQAITQPAKELTSPALQKSPLFSKPSLNRESLSDQEARLINFFKEQTENARGFKIACDKLLGRLTKEEDDTDELPEPVLQHADIPSISDDHIDDIFEALQFITECEPASHEADNKTASGGFASQTTRHPVRLCLHELPDSLDSASSSISVLISSPDMAHWQEVCIKM